MGCHVCLWQDNRIINYVANNLKIVKEKGKKKKKAFALLYNIWENMGVVFSFFFSSPVVQFLAHLYSAQKASLWFNLAMTKSEKINNFFFSLPLYIYSFVWKCNNPFVFYCVTSFSFPLFLFKLELHAV